MLGAKDIFGEPFENKLLQQYFNNRQQLVPLTMVFFPFTAFSHLSSIVFQTAEASWSDSFSLCEEESDEEQMKRFPADFH